MTVCFRPIHAGVTYTINTRGVDEEKVFARLSPKVIKESCEETGHCLICYPDGISACVKKTKKGNFIIDLGEEDDRTK